MNLTLSQRAWALVAGTVLSAATLVTIPGIAQAQTLSVDGLSAQITSDVDATMSTAVGGSSSSLTDTTADAMVGTGSIADVSISDVAAVDSSTNLTEYASAIDQTSLIGAVDSTTEVTAPVPAEGTIAVDDTIAVGDVVSQDICLNAGLNSPAGECGATGDGTAGATIASDVIGDASGAVEAIEPVVDGALGAATDPALFESATVDAALNDVSVSTGDLLPADEPVTANNGTAITEAITSDDQTSLIGAVDSTTEVTAPVPAEGTIAVDDTIAVGDVVSQDICLNAGLNSPAGECGATDGGATNALVSGTVGDVSGSVEAIESILVSSLLSGTVDGTAEVGAPLPVEGDATLDSDAMVDGLADLGICLNAGVNREPGACDGATGDAVDDGSGTLIDGDVEGTTGITSPLLPLLGTGSVDGDAGLGDIADLGICLNAAVNQDPDACGGAFDGTDEGGFGDGSGDSPVDGSAGSGGWFADDVVFTGADGSGFTGDLTAGGGGLSTEDGALAGIDAGGSGAGEVALASDMSAGNGSESGSGYDAVGSGDSGAGNGVGGTSGAADMEGAASENGTDAANGSGEGAAGSLPDTGGPAWSGIMWMLMGFMLSCGIVLSMLGSRRVFAQRRS